MKQFFIQLNATVLLFLAFSFHCMGADTHTLKYKLETGKTYKQNMVTVMNMKMNSMGQDINMEMTSEMNINYYVTGQNNDVFDLRITFQKIKSSMSAPMPFTVDSDSPENSTDKSLGETFKSLTEIPVDIQLSSTGKVVSVKGADKLAEKFNELSNEQFKQIFDQQFSEKALQMTFERLSSFFPEKPVAIGDSWDVTMNLNTNGIDIISKQKLTLKEVKDNIATLDVTGTLETPEGGAVLQIREMDATVSMKGEQTGTVKMDLKTGWVVNSEMTQNSIQDIGIMGQSMQQKVEVKVTVTAE